MSSIIKSLITKSDKYNLQSSTSCTKYFLEDEDWINFISAHVRECKNNSNNLMLIEIKTEIYNLFFDFDFKSMNNEGKKIQPEFINFIKKNIIDTCNLFFDEEPNIIISKNLTNNNLHFNFTNIHVRKETALNVRNKLIEKLFYEVDANWHDIIDGAILKNPTIGLRILGSPKTERGTGKKLDNGYRVITIEDVGSSSSSIENKYQIIEHEINVQQISDTLIRHSGKKETLTKFVETFNIDIPKIVDHSELDIIFKHITHPFKFSKKINNSIFIFLNSGPRKCMISDRVHNGNGFYIKKNMIGEYYYHCHSENCGSTPKLLFQVDIKEDFKKLEFIKISENNIGKESSIIQSEFLSYLNCYFSYILKQDCFMEIRDEQLFWYKSLSNRLNFSVPIKTLGLNKKGEPEEVEKKIAPYDIFTKSVYRKEYNNVIFEPYLYKSIDIKNNYNLFNGFKQTFIPDFKVDDKIIEPILNHFNIVWCKENKISFDFLMGWLADMVQRPGKLPGIALVVKGEQGSGKGSICNFFGNMVIGKKYYSSVNEINQLLGQFNSKLMNKILILCDEVANFGGAIANNNKLKGLITEESQSIQLKFKEPMDIKSCCRFVFLTNNEWPVKVESKDRRYFCLETDSRFIGNSDYFKNLTNNFTDEVALHVFHYLANYDLSKWNRFKIPMTKFRQELMRKSLPSAIQYILHLIETDSIPDQLSIHDMYDNYNSWFHTVEKTEHKKETLEKFSTTLCSVLNVRLKAVNDDDDRGYMYFDGIYGNCFLFTKKHEYKYNIAVTYNFHEPDETIESLRLISENQ